MAGKWGRYKVGDLFDLKPGFAFKSSDFQDSGVPVIKIKNVKANAVVLDDLSYVDKSFLKTKNNYIVNYGDILITMSGNRFDGSRDTWVGKVAQFLSAEPCLLNQRVAVLRPKTGVPVNQRCCTYILCSDEYQDLFITIATSSGGQANLSPSQILGADVLLPPYSEQRAIAHILGTLDDKIELNRRMNEALEAIARGVFKSWFVDFDPVRAKAEGRSPGLPKPIADLFPDSFEDSELGEIPVRWKVMQVGDALEAVGGGTPSTKQPNYWDNGKYCWATPKDLSGLTAPILLDTERKITQAGLSQISSGLLPTGTVLMSSRAPVGYLALAAMPLAINQGFIAMVCHGPVSNLYALNWVYFNMDEIRQRASGTTFAEISKAAFRPILMLVPEKRVMNALTEKVQPFYNSIQKNLEGSRILSALRDTLLPKLISGELRMKDAERFIGRAD